MCIITGDEGKTTCAIRYGPYGFFVVQFGLPIALATFCNSKNDVFLDFDRFYVVYLDNLVVYSKSLHDHFNHLRHVFARFRHHQLYVCKIAQEEIHARKTSRERVKMDERKFQTIWNG